MRIWGLSDTHLSFAKPKPMDIFGDHWKDHPAKIARECNKSIAPDDLLLMPGDLSWAMKRQEAEADLAWLASLPGIKIVSKGNHDYWWDSDKPLNFLGLYDTPFISEDGRVGIAGTRGWTSPLTALTEDEKKQDEKIVAREANRLRKRLSAIQDCPLKIALIHYPPIDELGDILLEAGVSLILYGHVHLTTSDAPIEEIWHGIRSICVACDRIHFAPRLIATLDNE